jgi:hypothetical protein
LFVCHPFRLSIDLSVFLSVCHLLHTILSVAFLPTSLSAYRLACLSFFHAAYLKLWLHCLPACLSEFLSSRLFVCLSPGCLSIGLSVFLPVCRLLPSFCYSPSYMSCLLVSCLPVQYVCLPSCLSVFLSWSCPSVYWSVHLPVSLSSTPIFLLHSLLPALSVAVLPVCTSACHLACPSFCHAACLSVCHPVCPSIGLSLLLPWSV